MRKKSWIQMFFDYTKNINDSKVFAGLVILTLNIATKFVSVPLSKSMELYVKHSFSRHILVLTMVWMATRDLWIALLLSSVFFILMEFLLNEESAFSILPEGFTDYYAYKDSETSPLTSEEIKTMQNLLQKAQGVVNQLKKDSS